MEAVFLKIINMSITASWLVVAVVLLRLVLKKAPKVVSLILWALVGIRLILPISLESVFSLVPSAQTFPSDFATSTTPSINSGIPTLDTNINTIITQSPLPSIPNGSQISTPGASPTVPGASPTVPGASPTVPEASPMETIVYIASIVWAAGVAIMLLYALVSYIRLRLRVREAVRTEGNVMVCDHIASPFILGIIRPKIYIPSSTDIKDVYYVLAHENAHLKRRDHFWKPLGFLLLSVYWFNPVLWVAYVLLCRDIELACDEKVIKELGIEAKKPYSTALVNCSVSHRAITVCPLAFGEVGVKRRVKNVLNYKKPAFWIIIVAIIACVVVTLCFLTNPTSDDNTTTTNPDTTTTTNPDTTTTVDPAPENYDIAYRKISTMYYYPGKLYWIYESEYNDKGQLVKETDLTSSREIEEQRVYEYDDEGNLVRESELDKYGTTEFVYDKHGNPLTVTAYDKNGEWRYTQQYSYEYEYYSDGTLSHERQYLLHEDFDGGRHLVSKIDYNQDGNPVYSETNGDFSSVTTYEYDENGRLIKKFGDSSFSTGDTSTIEYEYDANGNVSAENHTNTIGESGATTDRLKFKIVYEYDQYGNLTKETDYDENGDLHNTQTYEYKYGEGGVIETVSYYFNGELSSVTAYENPFKIYKQD